MKLPIFIFWVNLGIVLGGCCNSGFWCDGDPSFREQPRVHQVVGTSKVVVSWDTTYLNLIKCVDYFMVKYAPVNQGHVGKFVGAPVKISLPESLDFKNPLINKYQATFEGTENTKYFIQVVAVDKGLGWGHHEGQATVLAKPVIFRVKSFPDLLSMTLKKRKVFFLNLTCFTYPYFVNFFQKHLKNSGIYERITKLANQRNRRKNLKSRRNPTIRIT